MLVVLAVLLLVIGYLSFCLAKVGPKERAVLTFFGDPVDVLEPGLHFRWWLLQELEKFPTEEQKLKYDWHEVTTRVGVYQGLTSQEEIEKLGKVPEGRGQQHGSAKLNVKTAVYFFWPSTPNDRDGSRLKRALQVAPNPYDLDKIKVFFEEAIIDAVRIAISRRTWRECFEEKKALIDEIRRMLKEEENPFRECGIEDIYIAFEEMKLPEDLEKTLTEPEKARLLALAEENKAKGFAVAERIRSEDKAEADKRLGEARAANEQKMAEVQIAKERQEAQIKAETEKAVGLAKAETKKALIEAVGSSKDGLLVEALSALREMAQGTSNTIFYELPADISGLFHNVLGGKSPEALVAGLSDDNKKKVWEFLKHYLDIKE